MQFQVDEILRINKDIETFLVPMFREEDKTRIDHYLNTTFERYIDWVEKQL